MINLQIKYKHYSLKLKSPFKTSKSIITERKGIIIKIYSSTGNIGYGDAAPFPEFGSETYEETLNAIKDFKLNLKLKYVELIDSIENSLKGIKNLPALKHGIEQALVTVFAKDLKISLNHFLNVESEKIINVNAAIGFFNKEETVKKAKEFIENGFETLKLKVGRDNFEDDLDCIKAVRNEIDDEIKIRIDANGKWNLEEAIKNLKQLENYNIEYCEQPVKNIDDFVMLKSKSKIPIAADELIKSEKDVKEIIRKKAAEFLILKPMMLGGIIPTLKIIDLAKRYNIKTVVTSSFESAIGRSIAVFAASTIKDGISHGLATGNYFEKDIVKDPYKVKNGKIELH